jgi:hypothetical protein
MKEIMKQANYLILKMKREDYKMQERKTQIEQNGSEISKSKISDFNLTILTNASQFEKDFTSPGTSNLDIS